MRRPSPPNDHERHQPQETVFYPGLTWAITLSVYPMKRSISAAVTSGISSGGKWLTGVRSQSSISRGE